MRALASRLFIALAALVAFAASDSAHAQASMPQTPQVSPETRAKIQEVQAIQQKLDALRAKALENGALAKKQAALQTTIETEMKKLDPDAAKNLKRFDELKAEFDSARQSGDQEKARGLVGELQTVTSELRSAHAKAMESKKVSAAVEAFSDDLFAAMVKLEPEAEQMRARAMTLVKELQASAPQGPMQP